MTGAVPSRVTGGERLLRWLERVNSRHPWNHNEHFHGWIVRNLPDRRAHALDVGCGSGILLERLAPDFTHVTGVDTDPGMVESARRRVAENARITVHLADFTDFAATTDDGAFDLITMVASLHHLDLNETLQRIPRLLAPHGRLFVVGLARLNSPTDLAIDVLSALLNPVVGLVKHPRAVRAPLASTSDRSVMPVKDATVTFAEVIAAAHAALPGCTLRRRLFFRYTLYWQKPVALLDPKDS